MKKLQPADRQAIKENIIKAALHCFKKQGVSKTNLGDIAKHAGISRPLLYQYFSSRQTLIDAAVDLEFVAITKSFYKMLPANPTFTESIVESLIVAVKLVKERPWIEELFENIVFNDYPSVLLNPNRTFNNTLMNWWLPIFKRARETGELRQDIPNEDLVEWILSVTFMVIMREEISEERQRYFLTTFVIPALSNK